MTGKQEVILRCQTILAHAVSINPERSSDVVVPKHLAADKAQRIRFLTTRNQSVTSDQNRGEAPSPEPLPVFSTSIDACSDSPGTSVA